MKNIMKMTTAVIFLVSAQVALPDDGMPSSVWLVKTAGTWDVDSKYGYYRVVVEKLAGESARDFVRIEIVEAGEEGRKVVKTVTLDVPGYKGYVEDISFTPISSELMAISLDIKMKAMEGLVLRDVVLVSPDGRIRHLLKAEYKDIFD